MSIANRQPYRDAPGRSHELRWGPFRQALWIVGVGVVLLGLAPGLVLLPARDEATLECNQSECELRQSSRREPIRWPRQHTQRVRELRSEGRHPYHQVQIELEGRFVDAAPIVVPFANHSTAERLRSIYRDDTPMSWHGAGPEFSRSPGVAAVLAVLGLSLLAFGIDQARGYRLTVEPGRLQIRRGRRRWTLSTVAVERVELLLRDPSQDGRVCLCLRYLDGTDAPLSERFHVGTEVHWRAAQALAAALGCSVAQRRVD